MAGKSDEVRKSNLTYKTLSSIWHMDAGGLMVWREELVEFRKKVKGGEDIVHKARIITYVNMKNPKKPKLTRLLTMIWRRLMKK